MHVKCNLTNVSYTSQLGRPTCDCAIDVRQIAAETGPCSSVSAATTGRGRAVCECYNGNQCVLYERRRAVCECYLNPHTLNALYFRKLESLGYIFR